MSTTKLFITTLQVQEHFHWVLKQDFRKEGKESEDDKTCVAYAFSNIYLC